MRLLRALSFRDVGNALVRREFKLAGRITQNLVNNGVNAAQFQLYRHLHRPVRRATRRFS